MTLTDLTACLELMTYNVGLITGGTSAILHPEDASASATGKSNIIPPIAFAVGDLRCLSDDQITRTKDKMQKIVAAHLPQTNATISFDDGYPAMARTAAGHELVAQLPGQREPRFPTNGRDGPNPSRRW